MVTATAPPQTKRLPQPRRKAQLIEHAQELFGSKGYQGTSIGDIARAAGVTRPIVYKNFGDKEGIYLECLKLARTKLEGMMLSAAAQATTPETRLRAGINAYFEFVESQGAAWEVLFGGGAAIAGPAELVSRELRFSTVNKIVALLQHDLGDHYSGDQLQAFAHAISGAAEQLAKWWLQNPSVERDNPVEALMQICWTGLEKLQNNSNG